MNEFERLFEGKRYFLSHELDVSLQLLHTLHNANLLTDKERLGLSRLIDEPNFKKVLALVEVLCQKPYSLLHVFFDALCLVGQDHICKVLRPDNLFAAESCEDIAMKEFAAVSCEDFALKECKLLPQNNVVKDKSRFVNKNMDQSQKDQNMILKKKFRRLHTVLVKSVRVENIIDFLIQEHIITDDDKDLLHSPERTQKCRFLLNILHRSGHPKAFIKLYNAIAKEEIYNYVCDLIESTNVHRVPLYGLPSAGEKDLSAGCTTHTDQTDILKKIFRRVQNQIASSVNAASCIDFLYQEEVLTEDDVSNLLIISEPKKQCSSLLNILHESGHPEAFSKLYDAIAKQKPLEHIIVLIEDTTVQVSYKRSADVENERGANKQCISEITNTGCLRDLAPLAGVRNQPLPQFVVNLEKVSDVFCPKSLRNWELLNFFEMFLTDHMTRVRAIVFDKSFLQTQFKRLEGRRLVLAANSYHVVKPRKQRSANKFELVLYEVPKAM